MTFVCTFTHTVYGHSGNELMPPAVGGGEYAYLSDADEPLEAFRARMQVIGMACRKRAEEAPQRAYSIRDGWDWRFAEIRNVPD